MTPIYLEKSLGLDLREESVSLVLLGKRVRKIDILGFHFFRIKPLRKDDPEAEALFIDEIKRFLQQYDVSQCGAVVSLPRSAIGFQSFELPAPDRNVIGSMIEFEVEKHFFSKPEDLYYSYHVTEKSENRFHVVLATVKKDLADYYLQLLERLSLKPSILDVSTLSNLNLTPIDGRSPAPVMAVVDLSPNSIDIGLLKDGHLEMSRNVPIQDPAAVEAYFSDDLPPRDFENVSAKLGKKIIHEILETLSSCPQIGSEEPLEHIHLLGGGPYADTLAKQIQEESGSRTEIVSPPFGTSPALGAEFNPAFFTTSLGLALRELKPNPAEINLLPAELRPKKKRANIKTTLGLSVAAGIVIIGLVASEILNNITTLKALETQLQEARKQVGPLERVDAEYEDLKRYIDILGAIEKQSPRKLPALQELTQILPQETWLTDLTVKKEQVEIKGASSSSASALIPILENSSHFKDAGFNGAVVKSPDGEKFSIRMNLKSKP